MKSQGVVVGINRLLNKWLFLRLLKNAPASAAASAGRQMQVESAKSRLRGAPEILCRERFQTVPYDVHGNKPAPCLTRGRMRETKQLGVFQQPGKFLSYLEQPLSLSLNSSGLNLYS